MSQVHKEADNINLATQTPAHSPAPYHPGALRYFKEGRGQVINTLHLLTESILKNVEGEDRNVQTIEAKNSDCLDARPSDCSTATAVVAQQKTMSIGTGGTGGVYFPLGGAIANVLSKNLPNTQATAEVTGGSVDNLKLIATGQSELGFTMADAALDALNGVGQVQGRQGAAADAAGRLSEPDASRHHRGHRHRDDQ